MNSEFWSVFNTKDKDGNWYKTDKLHVEKLEVKFYKHLISWNKANRCAY